jgi:type I restriction enzyme S subunit
MSLMRIDDLFHFEKGILQSSKCTEGEFDFITASSEWKTHNEYTHDCEALVFAAAASGSLGRTHYVNGKFISSDLCFIITAKDSKKLPIDLKFYHMIFNEFKNDIVNSTKAGTSKEAIGMKAFGNYKLPYFDIDKQIETKVQFVNMQHSKIDINSELTHQLDLIKQMRQAFLREAMQGKLVKSTSTKETGQQLLIKIKAEKAKLIADKKLKKEKELAPITEDEIPFEIPEHWIWCRLGDVIDLTSGQDLSPHQYSDTISIGLPYITGASNLQKGKIVVNRWTSTPKSYAVSGDLLFTCKGSGIGKMAYLNIEKVHIARQIMSIRSPFILINYIEIILSNNIEDFRLNAKSLIPGIDRPQVFKLLLALPPLHEQEQIVAKLDELMVFCDGLEQSIKESQGYNEMLLQQVLREALQGEKQEIN